MSLLTELKDQLENLPEKKRRKNLTGSMKKYTELVADARQVLENVMDEIGFARTVFPDGESPKTLQRVKKAAALAAKLRKRLEKNIDAIARGAAERDVTHLVEHATGAQAELGKWWRNLLTKRIEPHETLVGVVRDIPKLAPKGGAQLGALLDQLRGYVVKPPASQTQANSVREGLDDLPRVIESLGLEGEVGEFLVQAASGLGDPEQLYRPAIRDFFRERDLWALLRVRIR